MKKINLALLSFFLSFFLSQSVMAAGTVRYTYDGTDGVLNDYFNQCTGCHTGDGVAANANWDEYGDASSRIGNYSSNVSDNNIWDRVKWVNDAPMYSGNSTNQTQLRNWETGGLYQNAPPYVETASIASATWNSTNSYTVVFQGDVNENGLATTFTGFYERTGSGGGDSSVGMTSPSGTGGNGASSTHANLQASGTNIQCGVNNDFYIRGVNAAGTTNGGNYNNYNITCRTGGTISGTPSNASEDSNYSGVAWSPTESGFYGASTFSLTGLPATTNPITINSASGVISWLPVEGETSASFTIRVTDSADDSSGYSDTLAVTINVNPIIDETPVITTAQGSITNATEDVGGWTFDVDFTDADVNGDSWVFSLSAQDDPDMTIHPTTGVVSWNPVEGESGDFDFTVRVRDNGGAGTFDDQLYTVTVLTDNEAPVITTSTGGQTATEDIAYAINMDATDGDASDTQFWEITSPTLPYDGMAINSSTGNFTWTPGEGTSIDRNQSVTIQVTDSQLATDDVTFNIAVTAVNDRPVLTPETLTNPTQDVPYSDQVSFTDDDSVDSHTFGITTSPTPTSSSLPIIDNSGNITWTPDYNDSGITFTFTVTVTDDGTNPANLASLTEDYIVTVTDANDAPTITSTPSGETATEDIFYTITIVSTDLDDGNPSPTETETWSITSPASLPDDMTIGVSSGVITWTPGETEGTTVNMVVQVEDSGGLTDTLAFNIVLSGVNDQPVITTASILNASQDVPYTTTILVSDDDASDVPPTNHTFGMLVSPTPTNTTPTIDNTGLISWTPDSADAGNSFTFTVTATDDSSSASVAVPFGISVVDVNYDPDITLPITPPGATEDSLYTFDLDATDPDDPLDTQDWSITSPAVLLDDMAVDANGTFTWTPSTEVVLNQSVTIQVEDAIGATDSETFIVAVTPIDEPPVITTLPASIAGATEDIPYTQIINFTDPDPSDIRTCSITNTTPTNATVSISTPTQATCQISWTPLNGDPNQQVSIRVTDSTSGTPLFDDETYTIAVTAVNDAPVINSTPLADQAATEDIAFNYTPTATEIDATDTLTWSITSPAVLPGNMAITTGGLITWTPIEDDGPVQAVTVRVTDNGTNPPTLYDEESFNINVTSVNDRPVLTPETLTDPTQDVAYSDQVSFTDPDTTDTYTFSISTAPTPISSALPVIDNSGNISWTPDHADSGIAFTFTVIVTDDGSNPSNLASVAEDYVVTVTNVNDAPVITTDPVLGETASEDTLYTYTAVATDQDDGVANPSETETWSITSASPPDDMAITPAGVLTWTPSEGIDRTEVVTLTVTDAALATDEVTFNIDVGSVNDAPTLSALSNDTVEENSLFEVTVVASDIDALDNTPDLNSNMTYAIDSVTPTPLSAGPSIDASGIISWTPGENDARASSPTALFLDYSIVVSVADGGEDGALPDTQTLLLTVTLQDDDSDTVPNYEDNCIDTANADQLNFDGDTEGDVCDTDDDNDEIPDLVELDFGLDPMDASDAGTDLDGDGISNLDEYNLCAPDYLGFCVLEIGQDSISPELTYDSAELSVDAENILTLIEFEASATDGIDGPVDVSARVIGGDSLLQITAGVFEYSFAPGRHEVEFTASDDTGNETTGSKFVNVRPIVTLGGSLALNEGDSAAIDISFNGEVPNEGPLVEGDAPVFAGYPITLTFSLSGTADASDYQLTSTESVSIVGNTIVINEGAIGETEEAVEEGLEEKLPEEEQAGLVKLFISTDDTDAAEGEETLTITLSEISGQATLGDSLSYEILISDQGIAPTVSLAAVQNAETITWFYDDLGMVTVTAEVTGNSIPTFDWSQSDIALNGTVVDNIFSFDPASFTGSVTPEVYHVQVDVDNNGEVTTKQASLVYAGGASALSDTEDSDNDGVVDADEGAGDSDNDGLPDYLDDVHNIETAPNLLFIGDSSQDVDDLAFSYIQTEPGLTISAGDFAYESATNDGHLSLSTIVGLAEALGDDGYVHIGSIYEFVVEGLTAAKRTAAVVIPLSENIPPEAVFRKFNGEVWYTFIEDTDNSLSSALSDENGCPAPNSELYESGLLAFRDCLQLIISDGGPNDSDGLENGTIVDPGGIAVPEEAEIFEPEDDTPTILSEDGPISAGALSLSILSLLMLCLGAFVFRKQGLSKAKGL